MPPTYDGEPAENWMNGLKLMEEANGRHILSLFALTGIPESILDVGCGDGAMVRMARRLGVRAYGIDQLVDETWGEGFWHVNLVDYWKAPEPVDIACCFEVAEHLHESAHATLCDTIAKNVKDVSGAMIVFSAARPGQDGTGHVACRPASYWHQQFILRGFSYSKEWTRHLGFLWANIESPLDYLYDNLIVFRR